MDEALGDDGVSVAGAWAVPYRRLPLSQSALSWPLGRIRVEAGAIVLTGAGLLKYVIPQRTIPLEAVDEITVAARGSLDPREDVLLVCSKDPRFDGIRLTAPTSEMRLLLAGFRRAGLRIA